MNIELCITKSANGDEGAFKELFDHLNDRLFRYALARTRSRDEALDVVQQTFIDLWEQLDRFTYSSDPQFYQYIYLILKRRIGKLYRRQAHVSLDEMSFEGVYEMDVYSEDELRTVLATMQKLKGSYREILHLRHWSGLSFKEIAGVMGGTESSVRVTHHRALESLKAKMPH